MGATRLVPGEEPAWHPFGIVGDAPLRAATGAVHVDFQGRTGLAAVFNENPDVVSFWAGEGVRRRLEAPDFAAKVDELDRLLSASTASAS
jgi:hypothetical protein